MSREIFNISMTNDFKLMNEILSDAHQSKQEEIKMLHHFVATNPDLFSPSALDAAKALLDAICKTGDLHFKSL